MSYQIDTPKSPTKNKKSKLHDLPFLNLNEDKSLKTNSFFDNLEAFTVNDFLYHASNLPENSSRKFKLFQKLGKLENHIQSESLEKLINNLTKLGKILKINP